MRGWKYNLVCFGGVDVGGNPSSIIHSRVKEAGSRSNWRSNYKHHAIANYAEKPGIYDRVSRYLTKSRKDRKKRRYFVNPAGCFAVRVGGRGDGGCRWGEEVAGMGTCLV